MSPDRTYPDLSYERALWDAGYRNVAGLDEVGRGAWAGPVVAAAVVLPPDESALAPLVGRLNDSKQLTAHQRESLDREIRSVATGIGLGSVPAAEVDRCGIVPATLRAMRAALDCLETAPDYLLLDFLTLPDRSLPQQGLPHGDARSLSIAAASVVAKVFRDAWMAAQESSFPGYGFAAHKGYGTARHSQALASLGPCGLHRLSFRPLNQ